jgi:hypothetical protein
VQITQMEERHGKAVSSRLVGLRQFRFEPGRRRSGGVVTRLRSDTKGGAPALPLWPMPSAPSSRRAYTRATAAPPVLIA